METNDQFKDRKNQDYPLTIILRSLYFFTAPTLKAEEQEKP